MNVTEGLSAPQGYRDAIPEVVAQVTNGCGPGGWKFDLIPDTIWGLSIKEECNIHDWRYTLGQTLKDKEEADTEFLNNILYSINHAQGFWAKLLRIPRQRRAFAYYEAVCLGGESAFWAGKEKPAATAA